MYTTPGVYFEQVDRGRPALGPLRTDIAGFLGYSQRGPLFRPVKVTNWRSFTAIFGEPLPYAHLAYAVQGFFANGGAACYITRVADPAVARAAQAHHAPLRLWASHGALLDPVTEQPAVEDGRPIRVDSPGAWGNRLAFSLFAAGLGTTATVVEQAQPGDGLSSLVASLSGFEVGSVVRVVQGGHAATRYQRVRAINPGLRQLVWEEPLAALMLDAPGAPSVDVSQPLRFETVEFTLLALLDGQIVERHENLSLARHHSRYVVTSVQANSRLVDVAVLLADDAELDPAHWPTAVDQQPLSGGHDGLATVDKFDFLAGLAALAKVDEVSLLAAPDAVLVAEETPLPASTAQPVSCTDLNPRQGKVLGRVLFSGAPSLTPLAGVKVLPLGIAAAGDCRCTDGVTICTCADGSFGLTNLPVGLVTLRFEKAGFHPLETTVEARLNAETADFFLAEITLPPALPLDDIYDVQAAMIAQGANGLYRVALLDPPPTMLGLEAIQTWRARFDSAFGVLYYPWLLVQAGDGGVRTLPPSGHVAGLIAHTDLIHGVHRAPANFVLDGVKALTDTVDDAQQGVLNPQGINCLRVLPGRGIRVYGARTLSSATEWRYLNVRRLLLMIEEAIEEANQWAVFEPNNQVLRQTLTYNLHSFLNTLWRRGALAGDTAAAAYQIRCDESNNPPAVVGAGQVVAEIAVAPTIPFEFIRFRLGRTVEAVEVTE